MNIVKDELDLTTKNFAEELKHANTMIDIAYNKTLRERSNY